MLTDWEFHILTYANEFDLIMTLIKSSFGAISLSVKLDVYVQPFRWLFSFVVTPTWSSEPP